MKKMKMDLFMKLFAVLALFACLGAGFSHPPPHKALIDAASKSELFDCAACTMATDITRGVMSSNATDDEMIKLIIGFCIDFKIENESVCDGIVHMFQDEFFFILESELSASSICGWFFGVCPFPNVTFYNVTFPKPKPPHVPPVPPNRGDPTFTIMQISDVHFDIHYTEGMNNDCKEPLCCRPSNGYGKLPNTTAGKWGDYQCDLNLPLLDNLANHWKTMPVKPDFVFWTGDNPPHDIWMQTKQGQINNSLYLSQVLKEALGDIPVIPCVGNHEGVPVNSFPLPPMNAWLMDALGDQWSVWLPEAAVTSFKYAGYYETPLNSKVKVVSLNMNYCNSGNGWLLLNNSDPGQMLSWLINVLQTAEDTQQKVYIIGHIPPGDHNCLPTWGNQFYQIVNRYEDTILAQFYGHTHNDQFEVFYDNVERQRPTSIAYIIPSVTTFQNTNPSYRIFTVDANSGYIVESSTYHVNITKANLLDMPTWEWEYNATTTYNMTSLFPADWAQVIEQMEESDYYFDLYYKYQSSSAPNPPCDWWCKLYQICQTKSGDSHMLGECMSLNGVESSIVDKYSKC